MEEEKLTKKILFEDYKEQPFEWMTEDFGCAEFIICPVFKKNKIIEVHLYPAQQPKATNYFVAKNDDGWEGIHFGSLLIEGDITFGTVMMGDAKKNKIEQPIIWSTHFCKEHKSHSMRFYVPRGSKSFFFTTGRGQFCFNWR